jgi:hypothetical protein
MLDRTPYAERDWPERLRIMKECEAAGSHFHERLVDGFRVAIGRDRYSATVEALRSYGFKCERLYHFPLGTDKPSPHLRHDQRGISSCAWLFADFTHMDQS